MNPWVEGTIVRNVRWNQALFTLEVDAQVAPFKAGQFTKLALFDEEREKNHVHTHMSMHPSDFRTSSWSWLLKVVCSAQN